MTRAGIQKSFVQRKPTSANIAASAKTPHWRRIATTQAVAYWGVLSSGDLAHGVAKGQAKDLDTEVYGMAGQVALRPSPIGVFDDQAGIGNLVLTPLPCWLQSN